MHDNNEVGYILEFSLIHDILNPSKCVKRYKLLIFANVVRTDRRTDTQNP